MASALTSMNLTAKNILTEKKVKKMKMTKKKMEMGMTKMTIIVLIMNRELSWKLNKHTVTYFVFELLCCCFVSVVRRGTEGVVARRNFVSGDPSSVVVCMNVYPEVYSYLPNRRRGWVGGGGGGGIVKPILLTNNMHDQIQSEIVNLLLYGDERLNFQDNEAILKATINYIRSTARFN